MFMIKKLKGKYIFVFSALIAVGISALVIKNSVPAFSDNKPYTVILDAGHGDPDGGAVGIGGTIEKDINLKVTLNCKKYLKAGVYVLYLHVLMIIPSVMSPQKLFTKKRCRICITGSIL